MDENALNFFSLDHFQNRYNIRVKPLIFFGIVSAVKTLQRQVPRTHQQYESPFNTFLKSQKSSKIVYKQLIANKSEKPISCIDKWHIDIHGKHLYNELKTNLGVYQVNSYLQKNRSLRGRKIYFLPWRERGFDASILEMPKNQNFLG